MAITFKSVGHFFAKAFTVITGGIVKAESTEATVETVTAAIPGGAVAVPAEKVAYMVLGEVASILTAGGTAANQKLQNAGLDVSVVTAVEQLLATVPQIVAVAKTL